MARHITSQNVQRVEPMHFGCVELVEQHSSTRSTRLAWQDVTSQVEFGLNEFRQWNALKIGARVVFPDVHVFETVDDYERQVVCGLADVVERMREFQTVRRQSCHHV